MTWTIRKFKTHAKKMKAQYLLSKRVHALRAKGRDVKVVIGSGSIGYEGWINTDLPVLNALDPKGWRALFKKSSIDRILAEQMIEHWTEDEFRIFLRLVRPFLSRQAFVRIAVPDGFHPDPSYIEYVRPGEAAAMLMIIKFYIIILLSQKFYLKNITATTCLNISMKQKIFIVRHGRGATGS